MSSVENNETILPIFSAGLAIVFLSITEKKFFIGLRKLENLLHKSLKAFFILFTKI